MNMNLIGGGLLLLEPLHPQWTSLHKRHESQQRGSYRIQTYFSSIHPT